MYFPCFNSHHPVLRRLTLLSALMALAFSASSQIVSTSDTAFGPSIPTTRIPGPAPTTASVSPCFDTLVVQIPANRWVYSVDVQYDMLAANNGWKSEQFSYLSCTTTGNKEASISQGTGNQSGLQAYSRTGLTIANGATTTGHLGLPPRRFPHLGWTCGLRQQRQQSGRRHLDSHSEPRPHAYVLPGPRACKTTG